MIVAKRVLLFLMRKVLTRRTYYRLLSWKIGLIEHEIALLPLLCDRNCISIDIGASGGDYSVNFLLWSRACVAFEPIPVAAAALRRKLVVVEDGLFEVECVAMSNRCGHAVLRIPNDDQGRSTLAETGLPDVQHWDEIVVAVRCLDDYKFPDEIAVIKIDVEGHEEAVLMGALGHLQRDEPCLLIEIEERHNPGSVRRVCDLLGTLGYEGYYFRDNRLLAIKEFRPEKDQQEKNVNVAARRRGAYINNFLFITDKRRNLVKRFMVR